MKPKVLVTEPILPPVVSFLSSFFELSIGTRGEFHRPSSLIRELPPFDGVLSMLSNPFSSEVFEALPNLQIVANHAVGFNNIDIEAAQTHQVIVTNTPDVLTEATADHTLALLLAITRKLRISEDYLRVGKFDGWDPQGFLGLELNGASLGIIGMGRIGEAVAKRALAFGLRIHYYQPHQRSELPFKATYHSSLEDLLRTCNIISVHCPLNEATHHLLSSENLPLLKRGSYLINTSRGPIIEEKALPQLLHSNHLAGVGLDVFEEEPSINTELLAAPNTILTPHTASATYQTRVAMGMLAAHSLKQVLIDQDIEGLSHRVA